MDTRNNKNNTRMELNRVEDKRSYLIDFLKKRKSKIESIDTSMALGAISHEPELYFQETSEVVGFVKNFFAVFLSSERRKNIAIENHHQKYNSLRSKEPIYSKCLSFVLTGIKAKPDSIEKKFCLVSLSGVAQEDSKLNQALHDCVKYCNSIQNHVEFIYLTGDTRGYSYLLSKIGGADNDMLKPCSEKFLGTVILKLKAIFKDRFRILGGVNCGIYPFEYRLNYEGNKSDDKTICRAYLNNQLKINDKYYLGRRPCCNSCRENKEASLTAWKGVTDYTFVGDSPTSPLLSNLVNRTSLDKLIDIALKYNQLIALSQAYKEEKVATKLEKTQAPVSLGKVVTLNEDSSAEQQATGPVSNPSSQQDAVGAGLIGPGNHEPKKILPAPQTMITTEESTPIKELSGIESIRKEEGKTLTTLNVANKFDQGTTANLQKEFKEEAHKTESKSRKKKKKKSVPTANPSSSTNQPSPPKMQYAKCMLVSLATTALTFAGLFATKHFSPNLDVFSDLTNRFIPHP